METNREIQRKNLHKTIWGVAEHLRGAADGWDFKQYVLGFLFYRFISENFETYIDEQEMRANPNDFVKYRDREDKSISESYKESVVLEKGFFIYPSQLFCNVVKNSRDNENLNEELSNIFSDIEDSAKNGWSEEQFVGLFDSIDVNSNKLGIKHSDRVAKLAEVLHVIANLNLGEFYDNDIDAFGDAYEFLMGMYASNAGKSGGEYYTPQEVSELLIRLASDKKETVNKIYDPTCGSGSLLLKSLKVLGSDKIEGGFYGQEMNPTTYNLCRMNMILHNVGFDRFNIGLQDTLTNPLHLDDAPFEVIVSNPPYSTKWAGDNNPVLINDERFSPAGILAPKGKADFAFIMHSLYSLSNNGTAAIVCFPGIFYRGSAEQKIRKYLVDNNFVDCVIQLPENLFYGTTIATCILVLKKNKKDNKILFIDAAKEYVKETNNNKLSAANIENLVRAYSERADKEHFTRLVAYEEIAKNKYNLSVSSYVEKEDTREKIDIKALNEEIKRHVARQNELRREIDKIIAEIEGEACE